MISDDSILFETLYALFFPAPTRVVGLKKGFEFHHRVRGLPRNVQGELMSVPCLLTPKERLRALDVSHRGHSVGDCGTEALRMKSTMKSELLGNQG